MSALTEIKSSPRTPVELAQEAVSRANSNAGKNVFLAMDPQRTLAEAEALTDRFPNPGKRPVVSGLPGGVKVCFDLAGYAPPWAPRFYGKKTALARKDSPVPPRLRQA